MNPELIFSLVNLLALVAWLTLIVRPRHPKILRWVGAVPVLFAALYCVLIAMRIGRTGGNFSSLEGVATLFRDPWILLAGWIHYLAFDLWVGLWELRDAASRNLPHWRVVPSLLLTFLFGPAGWLLYLCVRARPVPNRGSPSKEG